MAQLEMLDTLAARINEEHRASSCNILHVLDTPASPTRSELSYCVQAQALIMGSVNINLSEHARRRLREKGLTVADVREGRTFGMEFLDLENFREWLERGGGRVEIPEHIRDLKIGLAPA